jgi:hypothetical protein
LLRLARLQADAELPEALLRLASQPQHVGDDALRSALAQAVPEYAVNPTNEVASAASKVGVVAASSGRPV